MLQHRNPTRGRLLRNVGVALRVCCCLYELHTHISAKEMYAPLVTPRIFIDWRSFQRRRCCDGNGTEEGAAYTAGQNSHLFISVLLYILYSIIICWFTLRDRSVVQRCFPAIRCPHLRRINLKNVTCRVYFAVLVLLAMKFLLLMT